MVGPPGSLPAGGWPPAGASLAGTPAFLSLPSPLELLVILALALLLFVLLRRAR